MGRETLHNKVLESYVKYITLRDALNPPTGLDFMEACLQLQNDISMFQKICNTRYLNPRTSIPKQGSLHMAWEYAKDPAHHHLFIQMLRVSPFVFGVIHELIKHHPVFHNNSNVPQSPIDYQLSVTLFRMGRFGNAASLVDIARECGCSVGSVEDFTDRCFTAIEALHDVFVRPLTVEEKMAEKEWLDNHISFHGTWREGWVMYDGTIVVLYARPGLDSDAYYTRKANYGLNLQVLFLYISYKCHDYTVRATAIRRGAEWDAERNAVLAGDPKGLVYYVMID